MLIVYSVLPSDQCHEVFTTCTSTNKWTVYASCENFLIMFNCVHCINFHTKMACRHWACLRWRTMLWIHAEEFCSERQSKCCVILYVIQPNQLHHRRSYSVTDGSRHFLIYSLTHEWPSIYQCHPGDWIRLNQMGPYWTIFLPDVCFFTWLMKLLASTVSSASWCYHVTCRILPLPEF